MRKKLTLSCMFGVLLCVLALSVNAVPANMNYTKELKDYTVIATDYSNFVEDAIYADTNFTLLLDCFQTPKTKEYLFKNYSKSQVYLLLLLKLLNINTSDKYFTMMPILNQSVVDEIKKAAKVSINKNFQAIAVKVKALQNILKSKGNSDSTYCLMNYYILHSICRWDVIKQYKMHISARYGRNGTIFAFPDQKEKYHFGRFGISNDDFSFHIALLYNHDFKNKILKLFGVNDICQLAGIANQIDDEYVKSGKITSKKLIDKLSKYNIVSKDGKLMIPILSYTPENNIFKAAEGISGEICKVFPEYCDLKTFKDKYNIYYKEDALEIAYYFWEEELLKQLVDKKIISVPEAIADPEKATLESFRDTLSAFRVNMKDIPYKQNY